MNRPPHHTVPPWHSTPILVQSNRLSNHELEPTKSAAAQNINVPTFKLTEIFGYRNLENTISTKCWPIWSTACSPRKADWRLPTPGKPGLQLLHQQWALCSLWTPAHSPLHRTTQQELRAYLWKPLFSVRADLSVSMTWWETLGGLRKHSPGRVWGLCPNQ